MSITIETKWNHDELKQFGLIESIEKHLKRLLSFFSLEEETVFRKLVPAKLYCIRKSEKDDCSDTGFFFSRELCEKYAQTGQTIREREISEYFSQAPTMLKQLTNWKTAVILTNVGQRRADMQNVFDEIYSFIKGPSLKATLYIKNTNELYPGVTVVECGPYYSMSDVKEAAANKNAIAASVCFGDADVPRAFWKVAQILETCAYQV